jgi:hypothetical protein
MRVEEMSSVISTWKLIDRPRGDLCGIGADAYWMDIALVG